MVTIVGAQTLMVEASQTLTDLGLRIERLVVDPASISAPIHRLLRPILHRIGWRPDTEVARLRALVDALERLQRAEIDTDACRVVLAAAIDELEDNVQQVERATVINGRPLVPFAAWLRRCYEVVVVGHRTLSARKALPTASGSEAPPDGALLATLRDDAQLIPPMSMGRARGAMEAQRAADEPSADVRADPTRLLELQLDTVDHLMAAARQDTALLGRRRRLLQAARQLLLETSAALKLEPDGVQDRLENIGRQITLINRYEALGLRADSSLLHQARTALARGEHDKLFAALTVLQRGGADRGDGAVTVLTTQMLERLGGSASASGDPDASLKRSAHELFGRRVVEAIKSGYEDARKTEHVDPMSFIAAQVHQYFAPGREYDALAHALAVDGRFEVGGTLAPIRVQEEFVVHRVVPFPTQDLRFVAAQGPQDLHSALIEDPRTVILDLAAGRLLARRYLRQQTGRRPKTVMRGEVRVYVLDGSTSMIGPRARMRDAILVAELATLLRRLENPRKDTTVTLYFRYFNEALGPLTRVDTPGSAVEAIREVTATARDGGTDIQGALLSSMALIAEARSSDPDLARAQIVLVTDGEARVSEANVSAARAVVADVPLGISVVALGEENAALREIVARQRARGEQAFYHFVPDAHLEKISEGGGASSVPVHLPAVPRARSGAELSEALGPLLEQLADLERSGQTQALRDLDRVDRDYRVAPGELALAGEGERARLEALYRDDIALRRRYERWFPRPSGGARFREMQAVRLPPEGTVERDDLDSTLVVLATIADVVEGVGSFRRGREADAVDILERLLPDARLSPARYHEVLRLYPDALAPALDAVHGATRSGLGWRLTAGGV